MTKGMTKEIVEMIQKGQIEFAPDYAISWQDEDAYPTLPNGIYGYEWNNPQQLNLDGSQTIKHGKALTLAVIGGERIPIDITLEEGVKLCRLPRCYEQGGDEWGEQIQHA